MTLLERVQFTLFTLPINGCDIMSRKTNKEKQASMEAEMDRLKKIEQEDSEHNNRIIE